MMRRRARCHTDKAGLERRDKLQHLYAPNLPASQHLVIGTDRTILDHVLREIHSYGNNILLTGTALLAGAQ